jgi:D-alanine-D-alanine ligase
MSRTTVGVLRGGNSSEYDLSLKTGASVIRALPPQLYDVRDILVDKKGGWHVRGLPSDPVNALRQLDVAINAMHGGIGEDGTIGRLFETVHVPYTGSRPHASAAALNKPMTRALLTQAKVRMPQASIFKVDEDRDTADMSRQVLSQFAPPYVVKPAAEGSSFGVRIAPTVYQLPDLIADVLDDYGTAIVEQYIRGTEATVGVIEGFRGERLYALPPSEVRFATVPNTTRTIAGWHHIDTSHHAPIEHFSQSQKDSLMRTAKIAHDVLGLSHYSRADFIVTPNGLYLLEVNALPALHEAAPFVIALDSVGASLLHFLEHAIELALHRGR